MKLVIVIVGVALLSAIVFGRDLASVARSERARRESIRKSGERSKVFTNADLEAYPEHGSAPGPRRVPRPTEPRRDLKEEEAFWRRETLRHERELARLEANIRRLEWRLEERQAKWRSKSRVREDPAVAMIEQSLSSLREERDALVMAFRERARKAGAFPGWLREP